MEPVADGVFEQRERPVTVARDGIALRHVKRQVVIERGKGAGLADKPFEAFCVAHRIGWQDLQRDVAFQTRICPLSVTT